MHIQINTDHTIEPHEPLTTHVELVVREALRRFSERLSRVEVHLSTVNDHKQKGGDHRCLMEARIDGHSPIVASDHAGSLHQAIHGAAEKLKRLIDSTLGRIDDSAKSGGAVVGAEIEEISEENQER